MRFDIVTLFPDLFASFMSESLLAKALAKKLLAMNLVNPRDFTADRHRTVDDRPYGGGPGMVLKPEPVAAAIKSCSKGRTKPWRIFLSPSGNKLDQAKVIDLSSKKHLILVCGRYEGLDQRVIDHYIDEEISIGDYVVNGGEVPAMVLVEAVGRLLPGFMGKAESAEEESHAQGLLEYPHYTRPALFEDLPVPEVLLSGHHDEVAQWRLKQSLSRTLADRPDLLAQAKLSAEALKMLPQLHQPPRARKNRPVGPKSKLCQKNS